MLGRPLTRRGRFMPHDNDSRIPETTSRLRCIQSRPQPKPFAAINWKAMNRREFISALRGNDLAARFTRETPDLHFKVSDLAEREQHPGMFKPFYQMPERLPYRVYFDLDNPRLL